MNRRTLTAWLLGVLPVVAGFTLIFCWLLGQVPADASTGVWARHHSPDHGYDRAIGFLCSNGNIYALREGHTSREHCPGDVTALHARAGEVIVQRDESGDWHVLVNRKGKSGEWFSPVTYFSDLAVKVT